MIIEPSFCSSAPGAVDHPACVDGGMQPHDLDLAGLLVDAHLAPPAAPWCQCVDAMPLTGVRIEPALVDAPRRRRVSRPRRRSRTAASSAPAHHVRRAARGRAGVVGDDVGVRVGEIGLSSGSTPSSSDAPAARSPGARPAPSRPSRSAACSPRPSPLRRAIDARLGVCIPLRSTHRPLPLPSLAPADRVRGRAPGSRRSGRRASVSPVQNMSPSLQEVPAGEARAGRVRSRSASSVHRALRRPHRLHRAEAAECAVRAAVFV